MKEIVVNDDDRMDVDDEDDEIDDEEDAVQQRAMVHDQLKLWRNAKFTVENGECKCTQEFKLLGLIFDPKM